MSDTDRCFVLVVKDEHAEARADRETMLDAPDELTAMQIAEASLPQAQCALAFKVTSFNGLEVEILAHHGRLPEKMKTFVQRHGPTGPPGRQLH